MKREQIKLEALLEVVPPKPAHAERMAAECRNWALLHPALATLSADQAGLLACRQYMHIELRRDEGPRPHIMDRLYKRFSNLRRELETSVMHAVVPEMAISEDTSE